MITDSNVQLGENSSTGNIEAAPLNSVEPQAQSTSTSNPEPPAIIASNGTFLSKNPLDHIQVALAYLHPNKYEIFEICAIGSKVQKSHIFEGFLKGKTISGWFQDVFRIGDSTESDEMFK
jgi:hypothetical protein